MMSNLISAALMVFFIELVSGQTEDFKAGERPYVVLQKQNLGKRADPRPGSCGDAASVTLNAARELLTQLSPDYGVAPDLCIEKAEYPWWSLVFLSPQSRWGVSSQCCSC